MYYRMGAHARVMPEYSENSEKKIHSRFRILTENSLSEPYQPSYEIEIEMNKYLILIVRITEQKTFQ